MHVEQLGEGDPEVAVVGGIHGDEPCGVHAVEQIVDERPAVERPVKLIVANEEAYDRGQRYVDTDLNRSFPGDPDSEHLEERLAAALAEEIAGCSVLSLHSTQSYEGKFALVDRLNEFARSVCPRLSIDAVVEAHHAREGRIFISAPETIEVECGYQRSEQAAENAVAVTREFLSATGVLPDDSGVRRDDLPVYRLEAPIPKQAADAYEVYASNFERVGAGETFARAGDESLTAEEPFHPVLMSPEGYENVFGYTAQQIGTLEAEESA